VGYCSLELGLDELTIRDMSANALSKGSPVNALEEPVLRIDWKNYKTIRNAA
jgi:hypothetical protein